MLPAVYRYQHERLKHQHIGFHGDHNKDDLFEYFVHGSGFSEIIFNVNRFSY